ncbi:hypothetical protein NE237_002707 [Protea cynaroides]|uniref:Uncharacterized protein n=1 Tax=Protea cynaroides TaxID=273540 RepID=A0A9Q0KFH0_9MAGN|nr:hypothetical protein NE237_002707 [Protea cynaroides]
MDLQLQWGRRTTAQSYVSRTPSPTHNSRKHSRYPSPLRPQSKRSNSQQTPSGGDDSNNKGDRLSTDWNKAWSDFRKKGRKTLFSQFNPDKYVSWNPRRSNYPLSEEVDPIKRTERSNLIFWTSPRFTLAGAIVIVSLLLIYTLVYPNRTLPCRRGTTLPALWATSENNFNFWFGSSSSLALNFSFRLLSVKENRIYYFISCLVCFRLSSSLPHRRDFAIPTRTTTMEKEAAKSIKKEEVRLPPKRGEIKRKIIGKLVNSVVSTLASKGEGQGKSKNGHGSSSSSTSATSPANGYASDSRSDL